MCCKCPAAVTESLFSFSQVFSVDLFTCCGQFLIPVVLVGQSGGTFGLR